MAGIFLSYRRSGTSTTTYRLVDELRTAFGAEHLFLDVESIDPGIPFGEAIQESLRKSSIALIMIGPEWATMAGETKQPRIQAPDDWVRQEVKAALQSSSRVIPVLVQGAHMPEAHQLPDDIKALADLNAFTILPTQTHWSFDVNRLIEKICVADPKLSRVSETNPPIGNHTPAPNIHISYKVISGLAIGALILLTIISEGLEGSDEAVGAIVLLLVAAGLCIAGLLDILKKIVSGMKWAITGLIVCSLALLGSCSALLENMFWDDGYDVDYSQPSTDLNIDGSSFSESNQANLTGLWVSLEGIRIQITHTGNQFSFIEYNGQGAQVGRGQGTVGNGSLQFQYYNDFTGLNAQGSAVIIDNMLTASLTDPTTGQQMVYLYYRQ